jgi:hypothetical protein
MGFFATELLFGVDGAFFCFGLVFILIHAIYLRAELNASDSRKAVQRENGAQAHRTKSTGLVETPGQALPESLHQLL